MNSPQHEDRMDRIWAEAYGPLPQADFDRWRERHAAAVATLESSYGLTLRQRRLRMIRITNIATAAVLMIGVSATAVFLATGHNGRIAFADAVQQMRQVETATWTSASTTTFTPAKDTPAPSGWKVSDADSTTDTTRQWFYRAPNLIREEMSYVSEGRRHKTITLIIDTSAGKYLLIDPITKTAIPIDRESKFRPGVDLWMRLKSEATSEAESLGKRHINRHEAVGFRIASDCLGMTDAEEHTDVWVDPKSKNLVFIEITGVRKLDWGTLKRVAVMRDFVFNQSLDELLFSLKPPQGYKLTKPQVVSFVEVPEKDQSPEAPEPSTDSEPDASRELSNQ